MLTLHLLGHTYFSRGGQLLRLSGKATALLAYLTLEKQPHHRESLADLLWRGSSAMGNLRVELSKLRAQDINLGPSRSPLLSLNAHTDLESWQARDHANSTRPLDDWLSALRGMPLSGLEDLGNERFNQWLDMQRLRLYDVIEQCLGAAWRQETLEGHSGASILSWAEHLGLEGFGASQQQLLAVANLNAAHPPAVAQPQVQPGSPAVPAVANLNTASLNSVNVSPASARNVRVQRIDGLSHPATVQAIREVAALCADAPQTLLLSGRLGSGRRWAVREGTTSRPWLRFELESSRDQARMLDALVMQLMAQLPPHHHARAQALLSAERIQRPVTQLGSFLFEVGQPALLVVSRAETLTVNLIDTLGFMMDWPIEMMVVLLCSDLGTPRVSGLLGRALPLERVHHLTLPPLTPGQLQRTLGLSERRARLTVQQSEGWLLAARDLLSRSMVVGQRPALSARVQRALRAELDFEDPEICSLINKLAALPAPFSVAQVEHSLGSAGKAALQLALNEGFVGPQPPELSVMMPGVTWRTPDGRYPMAFDSELRRTALSARLPMEERWQLRHASLEVTALVTPQETGPASSNAPPDLAQVPELLLAQPVSQAADLQWLAAQEAENLSDSAEYTWQLPGNYRLTFASGLLEVIRLGWGESPTLHLQWSLPESYELSRQLQLLARLDAFSGNAADDYPLSLQVGDGRYQLHPQVGALGGWFSLQVPYLSGSLRLSFRARDLSLSVARLRLGKDVIPLVVLEERAL